MDRYIHTIFIDSLWGDKVHIILCCYSPISDGSDSELSTRK